MSGYKPFIWTHPAFPCEGYDGITIRQYFASMAMQALVSNPKIVKDLFFNSERIVMRAFDLADQVVKQTDL